MDDLGLVDIVVGILATIGVVALVSMWFKSIIDGVGPIKSLLKCDKPVALRVKQYMIDNDISFNLCNISLDNM